MSARIRQTDSTKAAANASNISFLPACGSGSKVPKNLQRLARFIAVSQTCCGATPPHNFYKTTSFQTKTKRYELYRMQWADRR
jgi:hypothetical protein